MQDNLVSVDWLEANLTHNDVALVDGSLHLPASGRDALEEFAAAHIPGAVYFGIDHCVTPGELPHMLPDADTFARYAGKLGINEQQHIVVYDSVGVFSAARVWWMFRHFGAQRVSVLNGGLPAWIAAGHALEKGDAAPEADVFNACVDADATTLKVVDAEQVFAAIADSETCILDARGPDRFSGAEEEFRPGLRSGHIPGSYNVPFTSLLDNGFFKSDAALRDIFSNTGVLEANTQAITSCGSGVTAAVLCLAMERLGVQNIALYDGSWTEWGALTRMPVDTTTAS